MIATVRPTTRSTPPVPARQRRPVPAIRTAQATVTHLARLDHRPAFSAPTSELLGRPAQGTSGPRRRTAATKATTPIATVFPTKDAAASTARRGAAASPQVSANRASNRAAARRGAPRARERFPPRLGIARRARITTATARRTRTKRAASALREPREAAIRVSSGRVRQAARRATPHRTRRARVGARAWARRRPPQTVVIRKMTPTATARSVEVVVPAGRRAAAAPVTTCRQTRRTAAHAERPARKVRAAARGSANALLELRSATAASGGPSSLAPKTGSKTAIPMSHPTVGVSGMALRAQSRPRPSCARPVRVPAALIHCRFR